MHTHNARLTRHAVDRMNQRGLPLAAVHAALDWGRCYRNNGAWIYRLDRRSVEKARRAGAQLDNWEGVTVVTGQDGEVCTTYRNRSGKRVKR